MPQPIMAILSCQNELSARARRRLGDVNEAGLIVSTVLGRAMKRSRNRSEADVVSDLWADFELALDRNRLS